MDSMNARPGVPLIGQQGQQKQAMLQQVVVNTYLGLIPVITGAVLARPDPDMWEGRENISERIAEEAWSVTRAAVKRIGIDIPESPPGANGRTKPE